MTPAQEAAFTAAAGGPSSSALLLAVASVIAVMALTWLAWLALRLFDNLVSRNADLGDLLWHLVRAAVVVCVLGWFVR